MIESNQIKLKIYLLFTYKVSVPWAQIWMFEAMLPRYLKIMVMKNVEAFEKG